jgi:phosphatidylglycerophosphate synthase
MAWRHLPHALSLSRVVFLPLLFFLLLAEQRIAFLVVYLVLAFTDFLDGVVARVFNLVSPLGKALDSIADLFFYIASAYFLYVLAPDAITANALWLILFFALLGLSFMVSAVRLRKPLLMHTHLLRIAAVFIVLTVTGSYLADVTLLVRATLFLYYVALLEEMAIFVLFPGADPDERSIVTLLRRRA